MHTDPETDDDDTGEYPVPIIVEPASDEPTDRFWPCVFIGLFLVFVIASVRLL